MEILELLEKKIDMLLERLKKLEQENKNLRVELEREKDIRNKVNLKIDNLLQKMEEIDIK